MYQFESLRRAGAAVAAMSDERDGDLALSNQSRESKARFLRLAGASDDPCTRLRQVHGCHIEVISDSVASLDGTEAVKEGDGLITAVPGTVLGVTVADCVPMLLFDPVARVVAAIHAGRAGTMGHIAAIGVHTMQSNFNAKPKNIHSVIGPSAGPCCYEVSEEIADQCKDLGMVGDGRMLNLWESNRQQLISCGLNPTQIDVTGHCTLCQSGFWSYRRQKTACRNLAIVGIQVP